MILLRRFLNLRPKKIIKRKEQLLPYADAINIITITTLAKIM